MFHYFERYHFVLDAVVCFVTGSIVFAHWNTNLGSLSLILGLFALCIIEGIHLNIVISTILEINKMGYTVDRDVDFLDITWNAFQPGYGATGLHSVAQLYQILEAREFKKKEAVELSKSTSAV